MIGHHRVESPIEFLGDFAVLVAPSASERMLSLSTSLLEAGSEHSMSHSNMGASWTEATMRHSDSLALASSARMDLVLVQDATEWIRPPQRFDQVPRSIVIALAVGHQSASFDDLEKRNASANLRDDSAKVFMQLIRFIILDPIHIEAESRGPLQHVARCRRPHVGRLGPSIVLEEEEDRCPEQGRECESLVEGSLT